MANQEKKERRIKAWAITDWRENGKISEVFLSRKDAKVSKIYKIYGNRNTSISKTNGTSF